MWHKVGLNWSLPVRVPGLSPEITRPQRTTSRPHVDIPSTIWYNEECATAGSESTGSGIPHLFVWFYPKIIMQLKDKNIASQSKMASGLTNKELCQKPQHLESFNKSNS